MFNQIGGGDDDDVNVFENMNKQQTEVFYSCYQLGQPSEQIHKFTKQIKIAKDLIIKKYPTTNYCEKQVRFTSDQNNV